MDIEFYKRAIAEAFPQLVIKDIELDCSGWDNIVVIVNREIIFRFPRRLEAARTLEIERRLLPELAKVVSLPILHFEFVTPDFVGYRLIPGEPLTNELFHELSPIEKAQIACQLAEFLTEIHKFLVERAIELGVPHTPDRKLWANFYADIQRHVFPLLTVYERQWAQELFETFLGEILYGVVCGAPEHVAAGLQTLKSRRTSP